MIYAILNFVFFCFYVVWDSEFVIVFLCTLLAIVLSLTFHHQIKLYLNTRQQYVRSLLAQEYFIISRFLVHGYLWLSLTYNLLRYIIKYITDIYYVKTLNFLILLQVSPSFFFKKNNFGLGAFYVLSTNLNYLLRSKLRFNYMFFIQNKV